MLVQFNEIRILSKHSQAYWEYIQTLSLCVGGIILNVWGTTDLLCNLEPVKESHEPLPTMNGETEISLGQLHSLISMKSCLFSTMALPRLLPSSIILWHIRQQSMWCLLLRRQRVHKCNAQLFSGSKINHVPWDKNVIYNFVGILNIKKKILKSLKYRESCLYVCIILPFACYAVS